MNFIYDWQLIKAYQDFRFPNLFYDICTTFYTIYYDITGTAHDGHFPDPYNFDYLTKHITLKLLPFLQLKGEYPYYLLLVYLPE